MDVSYHKKLSNVSERNGENHEKPVPIGGRNREAIQTRNILNATLLNYR
jgi:hypothetical protein